MSTSYGNKREEEEEEEEEDPFNITVPLTTPQQRMADVENFPSFYPSPILPAYKFHIKIKYCCVECHLKIINKIMQGALQPLKSVNTCYRCGYMCIRQPYMKLCSYCARLINRCTACSRNALFAQREAQLPWELILSPMMDNIAMLLPSDARRYFIRMLLRKYKEVMRNGKHVDQVQKELMDILITLTLKYKEFVPMPRISR